MTIQEMQSDILRLKKAKRVYVLEEGSKSGGIGEKIAAGLTGKCKVFIHAIEGYVGQGSQQELLQEYGFTAEQITKEIQSLIVEEGK